jgi:hypothetical protein
MKGFSLYPSHDLKGDYMKYYHGSENLLPVGTILKPPENYEEKWSSTDFYAVLEKYRPENYLSHKEAVFLVDNEDDIDNVGGCTDFIFVVKPLSKVEKHDMN